MPYVDFPFCGPTYAETSPVIDASRSINLYPDPAIATSKTQMALIGRPGLSQTGFALTLPNSPVRSLWAGDNRLFAVGGTHFFELGSGGTVLTDYGAMAGSTGGITDAYAIANGTQLLVYDSSSSKIYNANAGGPAMTQVFEGTALEYLDGFYVAIAAGGSLATGNPNQVNISALGDGTTWPALDFVIRTGASDLITQLAVLAGQLWIFGQKSIEIWFNAGNPLFPFARVPGATINLGLMAPGSVVKFQNTILWLGADDRGYPIVYRANGMQPERISNFGIEYLLSRQPAGILPLSQAYGYQEAGHTFYVLNIVGQSGIVATYVYDLSTGLWHERIYIGSWPICFASVPGFNSNGPNFVGDSTSGKICFQSIQYPSDLGSNITYYRASPHVADKNRFVKYQALEIDADIGTAQITLSYSNDGGRNFLTLNRSDVTKGGSNDQGGAFPRFKWWQLGRSRDRVFAAQIVDKNNLIRLIGAYLQVEAGNER